MVSAGRWQVPASRGVLGGVLLVLLGIWGGLVPFLGPQFGYAYTPDTAWTWTWGRFWLEILPAAAAIVGGFGVAATRRRVTGLIFGWLAAAGGAWFIVGPSLSVLWTGGTSQAGIPAGDTSAARAVQEIGFFYGLGAVILFVAALILGRFTVLGVREATSEPQPPTADTASDTGSTD
jgi:hypothetical protein